MNDQDPQSKPPAESLDEIDTEAMRKLIEFNSTHPGFVIPAKAWERLRDAAHAVRALGVDPAALLEAVAEAHAGQKPKGRGKPADLKRRIYLWRVWPRLELFRLLSQLAAEGADRARLLSAGAELIRRQLAERAIPFAFVKMSRDDFPLDVDATPLEQHVDWFIEKHAGSRRKDHRALAVERLTQWLPEEKFPRSGKALRVAWDAAKREYAKLLRSHKAKPAEEPSRVLAAIRHTYETQCSQIPPNSEAGRAENRLDTSPARRRVRVAYRKEEESGRTAEALDVKGSRGLHGLGPGRDERPAPSLDGGWTALPEERAPSPLRPARRRRVARSAKANQHQRPRPRPGEMRRPP